MKRRNTPSVRLGLVVLALATTPGITGPLLGASVAGSPGTQRNLPLFFVPSRGQAAGAVQYALHSAGFSAYFAPSEARFDLGRGKLAIRFDGANSEPRIEAIEGLAGKVNFLVGDRREDWQTDVPAYGAIAYRGLYAGIDLVYRVAGGRLKTEFWVEPGADPRVIRWRYRGSTTSRIDASGGLVVATAGGQLREEKPALYQEADGARVPIEGGFRLLGDGSAGFTVADYDRTRALVIDPEVTLSTYLGGSGMDAARAVAVDDAGNAYVAGYTDSLDFPTANPLQGRGGGVDAFVAKLSAADGALVYCTYLGGSGDDRAFGVAVDADGNAYLAGWTYSSNFPTTSGAVQRRLGGGRDAFAVKLNASGDRLLYSTYLGGSGHDTGNGIAIDASGNAYIAGDTYSTNFPARYAFQSTSGGGRDGFVLKLNPSASALVWSTYLGGRAEDCANAIAVDSSGAAYVTGGTMSTNFPVYHALRSSNAGGQDAFVSKLSSDGRTLAYSTYLGGSGGTVAANEMGMAIQVDSDGNAYVAGMTSSPNFPTVNALQPAHRGGTMDAFAAKLNPAGSALVYSTYLGGSGADYAYGIALDSSGAAVVGGYTSSSNLPVVAAVQPAKSGGYDGFLMRLTPAGNALDMATYWGGRDSEALYAVALGGLGDMWIAGQTLSADLPLQNPVQESNAGGYSGFVARIGRTVPTAVFRAANGNIRLTMYGSTDFPNSGGWASSEPALAQSAVGETYIIGGRDDIACMFMNTFRNGSRTWKGWVLVGCDVYSTPAVAATPGAEVYLAARDANFDYMFSHYSYRPGYGFDDWIPLGGSFASEPSIARAKDGTIYIVGRKSTGAIWSGRYVPGTGFQGWVPTGAGAPVATGKPAITIGLDGAAYVAVRAANGTVWMARLQGDVWGSWFNGGGQAASDPDLAASSGTVYTAMTTADGSVYVQAFTEGSGNGWQGWVYTQGHLLTAAISAEGGVYYIAGRSLQNELWWFKSGAGWTNLGNQGLPAGIMAASPK